MMKKKVYLITLTLSFLSFSSLFTKNEQDLKYQEKKIALLKASQNPLEDMYTVPMENNFNFDYGKDKEMQYVLNIQPILPFKLTGKWLFVNRSILPIISQPVPKKKFGLGDFITSFYLVPPRSKHFGFAFGPIFELPSATDEHLGTEKFSIGPSFVYIYTKNHFLFGTLYYNLWSVAGKKSREVVNHMYLEPFYYYNFPHEWYFISAPIIKAHWRESKRNVWFVPVGGGFGKLIDCNNQIINLNLALYYNIKRPEFRDKWTLRFVMDYLFPK